MAKVQKTIKVLVTEKYDEKHHINGLFFKLSVQGEKDIMHLSLEVECDICGQRLIKPTVSKAQIDNINNTNNT